MISRNVKRLRVLKRRSRKLWRKYFPKDTYGTYRVAPLSARKLVVITEWNSPEGCAMLMRTPYNKAFFRLAHNYQPQMNPFYCSIASMVTALNTLRLHKGKVPNQKGFEFELPSGEPITYRLYSQLTLLNDKTETIKRKVDIAPSLLPVGTAVDAKTLNPGLDLHEVVKVLEIHEAAPQIFYAELPPEHGTPRLRDHLKLYLNDDTKVMIANFDGKTLGASTGGHYSLMAAYDEESDNVLILDTAAHKNPWLWVPLKHLYFAMHTRPPKGTFYRGHIVVSDRP